MSRRCAVGLLLVRGQRKIPTMAEDLDGEQILDGVLRWVNIETPSSEPAAVNQLVDVVEGLFDGLAAETERIPGSGGRGDHFVARSGPGPGVLVLCHLDTVHPLGSLEARPIRRDGDKVFAPGIYDMKGGAYIAYLAFKTLAETSGFGLPVTVVFTSDEEAGSPTSRGLVEQEAKDARYAMVLEPARAGGKAVTKRFGLARYEMIAHGHAAHAGVDPERGRSAILELAHHVLRIEGMKELEKELITNVGVIQGGTTINTVAAHATMAVEVRFADASLGLPVCEAISESSPVTADVELEVLGGVNRLPFVRTAEQREFFVFAQQVARDCGFDLGEVATGGGSDASFAQAMGVPTLCGLGVEGGGAHAVTEHALVSRLLPRYRFITRLMQSLR